MKDNKQRLQIAKCHFNKQLEPVLFTCLFELYVTICITIFMQSIAFNTKLILFKQTKLYK
jgi:hypothetical protein